MSIHGPQSLVTVQSGAANDALTYTGVIDCSANPNYPAADAGATYKVSVAGKIGGGSGPNVEVGDLLVCTADGTLTGTHAAVGASWTITQANIDGALLAANNLSDVASAGTSRTNLGLGTAAVEAATAFVAANAGITGATKTKVTYDAKGLVTAGADATTADIADSADKRYCTDAQKTVISNTSGTNTGDQTSVTGNAGTATTLQTARNIDGVSFNGSANITVIAPGTNAATSKATPVDADELPLVDSAAANVLKKLTWANLKATLKSYFDTLYAAVAVPTIQKFTSGSGTYTTPAGVRWIRVRMVGGGGGGCGSGTGTSAGTSTGGGNTTFGTTLLVANGGGGVAHGATGGGGAGGSASLGTGPIGFATDGERGEGFNQTTANTIYATAGAGGDTPFRGRGVAGSAAEAGGAAIANTGAGGGGGGGSLSASTFNSGSGGGAGGYVEAIITAPSSTYSYAVGAAGAAGTAGTSGLAGGAGAAGIIIVEEHY